MRTSSTQGRVSLGTAALLLLAGCSGGASQTPLVPGPSVAPQSVAQRSSISPKSFVDVAAVNAPGGSSVFISDDQYNTVTVFNGAGNVTAVLNGNGLNGPQGLTTDSSGTLYVANSFANSVLVFKKPYNTSPLVISSGNYTAKDVAWDSSTGNIGIPNLSQASGPTGGSVSIYRKGATIPCVTVNAPESSEVLDRAGFDGAGNLYVVGQQVNYPYGAVIGIVRGGCHAKTITLLSTGNALGYPGGIKVLKNGNVLYASGNAILTYAPASGSSLGSPIATTPMFALFFDVTADDKDLWTGGSALGNGAFEYAYPAGGSPIRVFSNGRVGLYGGSSGVAVSPPQVL